MLAKKYRLPISAKERISGGKVKKSQHFLCRAVTNDLPYGRFGVIVGQKNAKKACLRNLIRRTVFESIRTAGDHIKPGRDVLLIALSSLKAAKKSDFLSKTGEIENEIRWLLK